MIGSDPGFDEHGALARMAGAHDLLKEISAIYIDTYESMLRDVRAAIAAGDGDLLKSSAHRFKGTVSSFGADAATMSASQLEELGRRQELDGASELLVQLERQAVSLAEELAAYCARG